MNDGAPNIGAATHGVGSVAASATAAAEHAQTAAQEAQAAKSAAQATDSKLTELLGQVTVADPTTRFEWWEQAPAWVLWVVALVLAFVMVDNNYTSEAGWTFAIVALIVGVLLSYRTKFSLGGSPGSSDQQTPAGEGQ